MGSKYFWRPRLFNVTCANISMLVSAEANEVWDIAVVKIQEEQSFLSIRWTSFFTGV